MQKILKSLGISDVNPGGFAGEWVGGGKAQTVVSPINGEVLATVANATPAEFDAILAKSHAAFASWKLVPAPKRGEVVKAIGDELRRNNAALAELVTLEMGKTLREGLGEVQEMIDICDFAVGLSRQLYGLTMPSERRGHRLQEQWHPLGVVGVITAFNFPVAVWSWNTAIALVCGDTILWKPSSKTPLTAIACTKIAEKVLRDFGFDPAICSLAIGRGSDIGDLINTDPRVALVSYTGSVPGGRHVGKLVQERFGKHILELGGNNAVIVSERGIWRSRCVPSTSAPSAPRGSVARPPAASSSTSPSIRPSRSGSWPSIGRRASAIPGSTRTSWGPWWTPRPWPPCWRPSARWRPRAARC